MMGYSHLIKQFLYGNLETKELDMTIVTLETQLKEVVKTQKQSPSTIMAQALEIGLASLYRESILKSFLHKRLSRQKAVEHVGLQAVTLAEEQHAQALTDVDWGMKHGKLHR